MYFNTTKKVSSSDNVVKSNKSSSETDNNLRSSANLEKYKQIADFFDSDHKHLNLKSNKITYYHNMAKIHNRTPINMSLKKKEFIPIGDIIDNARENYIINERIKEIGEKAGVELKVVKPSIERLKQQYPKKKL